jgi:hypothetical protein
METYLIQTNSTTFLVKKDLSVDSLSSTLENNSHQQSRITLNPNRQDKYPDEDSQVTNRQVISLLCLISSSRKGSF